MRVSGTTVVKTLLTAVAVLAIGAVVAWQLFDVGIVLDGGGAPRLARVRTGDEQAARVAEHRAAQRAAADVASVGVEPADDGGGAGSVPSGEPTPPPDAAAVEGSDRRTVSGYWTDFRGPARDGEYRERPITTEWPRSGLVPVWKQPSGGGYASFVVAGGRAFTIEQRGREEVVAAYDVRTGREVWTNRWPAEFRESMGGDGPRATPTWADGVLFALGAEGEFRALDAANGSVRWRTNILDDNGARNVAWGMSAAPLVVDETVVVHPGGSGGRSVVAYDRHTGARVWSALDDEAGYASPMLVTLGGVRQLLVFTATRLVGLTPGDGQLLWEYPFPTYNGINASQPLVVGDDRVFVSASYGAGAALIQLSGDASGFAVREVWRNNRMKNRFSSSVLLDGTIYGLDEAILAAMDVETGELKWKGGRYGYGQLVLAGVHLIVLTEDGDVALVRANPDRHEELVRFPVLEGKTWNVPVLDGGYLLVRNLAEMAAFDLRPPAEQARR